MCEKLHTHTVVSNGGYKIAEANKMFTLANGSNIPSLWWREECASSLVESGEENGDNTIPRRVNKIT